MTHIDVIAYLKLAGFKKDALLRKWNHPTLEITIYVDNLKSCMPYEMYTTKDDIWWFDAKGLIEELGKVHEQK